MLQPGDVIADRFEIDRTAGSGGFARVYRAVDRVTGTAAAIKVIAAEAEAQPQRFAQEAQLLARLQHPGVVSYRAHGQTADGDLFLAMEWLEGEDLQARLTRGPLPMADVIGIGRRIAEALAYAHGLGVIHRDIKPGNILLPDGDVERAKLLDFGVAQSTYDTRLTEPGIVLGTLGYMAPEQAREAGDVDQRADLYSLGCVLFECLTGHPPFVAEDRLALLARIVLDEPPRASEDRRDTPRALDDLVASLLAKEPTSRPPDAGALVAAMTAVQAETIPDASGPRGPKLTSGERRLLCVIVSRAVKADTIAQRVPRVQPTVQTAPRPDEEALRLAAVRHGGQLSPLKNGSLLVTLGGDQATSDAAAAAARCALTIRELLPNVPLALATGRGSLGERGLVGDVLDRAAGLLRAIERPGVWDGPAASPRPCPILLDPVTARLLGSRFDVGIVGAVAELLGEREEEDAVRTLLGRATPFVGREQEFALLTETATACLHGGTPRVVLVTGPSGSGKTRLKNELVRLERRSARWETWTARGDATRSGTPYGVIGELIRDAAGILGGESLETRHAKLRALVALRFDGPALVRITEFLGEIIGAPFPDDASVPLRAARRDPVLLSDQVRLAFEDWLDVECAARPVWIVLEDLHWGDGSSVKLLDTALHRVRARPLFVLALARPDVGEIFPELLSAHAPRTIELAPLRAEASERLVRHVLGEQAEDEVVLHAVDRAAGNPFFLEEILRSVADGRGRALPETVLAIVETRIEALPAEARKILRAASVFGERFWRGGVGALLDEEERPQLEAWLTTLVGEELVVPRDSSRFADDEEYVFRHALLKEAAYAMLTEEDRRVGHALAASWLEQAGEADAVVLAQHFERGGVPRRAADCYLRAAEQSLAGNDVTAVVDRTDRGIACDAQGEVLGRLLAVKAEARTWRGQQAEALDDARAAMPRLGVGSPAWYMAAGAILFAHGHMGDLDALSQQVDLVTALPVDAGTAVQRIVMLGRGTHHLMTMGRHERADAVLAHMGEVAARFAPDDDVASGWLARARGMRAGYSGDAGSCVDLFLAAAAHAEKTGSLRNVCVDRSNAAYELTELGEYAEAERILSGVLADAQRMGLAIMVAAASQNLAVAIARQERILDATVLERHAIGLLEMQGARRMEGRARSYLAGILLAAGDLFGAEFEARRSLDLLAQAPPARSPALATLARILLAKGEPKEALHAAKEAMAILEAQGVDEGESLIRLVHVEALVARERTDAAYRALCTACDRIVERAAKIARPTWRQSFLARVPENARTLALRESWTTAPA